MIGQFNYELGQPCYTGKMEFFAFFIFKMKNDVTHCGIDVSLKSHSVCLLDSGQKTIRKFSILNDRDGFETLENNINKNALICLEPTGIYSLNIFLYLKNKGYDIKFCGTYSASCFRKSLFGKKKHDNLDCVALAKYRIINEHKTFDGMKSLGNLFLKKEYGYDREYLLLSDLLDQYAKKIKFLVKLKNRIKNIIDVRFPEAIQIFSSDRGCKTILKMFSYPKEDVLSGKVKLKKLKEIQKKLKRSIGQYNLRVLEFNTYAKEMDQIEYQIKKLKEKIKELIKIKGYSYLFNYKGLNVVNIATFIVEIRDIRRFFRFSKNGDFNKKRSLRAFKEFLGLTVTSNQSGEHEGGHKLVKSGNTKLRSIIFMLTLSYLSIKLKEEEKENTDEQTPEHKDLDSLRFRRMYYELIKKKKKMIAVTKVMSKVATDLFFILKDNVKKE